MCDWKVSIPKDLHEFIISKQLILGKKKNVNGVIKSYLRKTS